MAYIKNISHEEVLHLADQVSADKGQIVSKNISTQNGHVSDTCIFAFQTKKSLHMILLVMQWFSLLKEPVSSLLMAKNIFCRQDTLVMPAKKTSFCLRKKTLIGFSLLYFLHKIIL